MTREQFVAYIQKPERLIACSSAELRQLLKVYPYSEQLVCLYLKKLKMTDDVLFESELERLILWITDKHLLHQLLFGEKKSNPVVSELDIVALGMATQDYFSDAVQRENSKKSFAELATQLKESRKARVKEIEEKEEAALKAKDNQSEMDQQLVDVKKLIAERKFAPALEILESLNLKFPEKSVYFAVQIKYLKTILQHNK